MEMFESEYYSINEDLSLIEIKERNDKEGCFIRFKSNPASSIKGFILYKKQVTTVCELSFHRSSKTRKYIPRPVFKKLNTRSENATIEFNDSEKALNFWKLVGFLSNYKKVVDLEEFENSYSVIKKNYFIEFQNQAERDKINDIKQLIDNREGTKRNI